MIFKLSMPPAALFFIKNAVLKSPFLMAAHQTRVSAKPVRPALHQADR